MLKEEMLFDFYEINVEENDELNFILETNQYFESYSEIVEKLKDVLKDNNIFNPFSYCMVENVNEIDKIPGKKLKKYSLDINNESVYYNNVLIKKENLYDYFFKKCVYVMIIDVKRLTEKRASEYVYNISKEFKDISNGNFIFWGIRENQSFNIKIVKGEKNEGC